MERSNPIDASQLERMSGDGHVMPTDAAGLRRYWQQYGFSRLGMPRADFVTICRTLIRNGLVTAADRDKLVAAGWRELRD
jgi:hypothetical protein